MPEQEAIEEQPLDSTSRTGVGIQKICAWTGSSSLQSTAAMQRDVAFCKIVGIGSVSIMVNDFSRARSAKPFSTVAPAKLLQFSALLREAGIDVVLTSWIMPHAGFLDGAITQLPDLVHACRARALEWDAEAPWTQAIQPMPYGEAARKLRDAFDSTRMGVNAIGYTDAARTAPLAEICDYIVPQIYCTSTSKLDPDTDVELIAKRYRDLFGHKNTVVGLAAYRQSGIPGHTIESALRAAFKHTQALGYVRAVCYWSLSEIRRSVTVTSVIKSLANPNPEQIHISASVGSGGANQAQDVEIVQRLLEAHGYDVGVVDGVIGPRTIAAIKAFQTTLFSAPDGRIDPGGETLRALGV